MLGSVGRARLLYIGHCLFFGWVTRPPALSSARLFARCLLERDGKASWKRQSVKFPKFGNNVSRPMVNVVCESYPSSPGRDRMTMSSGQTSVFLNAINQEPIESDNLEAQQLAGIVIKSLTVEIVQNSLSIISEPFFFKQYTFMMCTTLLINGFEILEPGDTDRQWSYFDIVILLPGVYRNFVIRQSRLER